MKRKTFLKSLVGLAIAPMALAKIKQDEYVQTYKEPVEIEPLTPQPLPDRWAEALRQHRMEMEEMFLFGVRYSSNPTTFGTLKTIKHPYFIKGISV